MASASVLPWPTAFVARAQGEEGDTVYEYLVTEDRAGWQPWRERVPSWKYPRAQARARAFLALSHV